MDIIIFDTETYGYILSLKEDVHNFEAWPHLKQLSWVTYNLNGTEISTNNYYFDKEDSNKSKVLKQFIEEVKSCRLLIAHNFLFDCKIISTELLRNSITTNELDSKPVYDSMTSNLDNNNKYPTLTELHIKLIGKEFKGAHDALNDVKATARCFWHLRGLNKIDFEQLPDVKTAIQIEEEKIFEQLNDIYSTRKHFGNYLFDACEVGIIGKLIDDTKNKINNHKRLNTSSYSIFEHPELMLDWIYKIEKAYLNGYSTKPKMSQYIEYSALTDTVDYLKTRGLYFPRESMQLDYKLAELIISSPGKTTFQQIESIKLYELIANIINSQEAYTKIVSEHRSKLTKPGSGCLLSSILIISIPSLIYTLYILI